MTMAKHDRWPTGAQAVGHRCVACSHKECLSEVDLRYGHCVVASGCGEGVDAHVAGFDGGSEYVGAGSRVVDEVAELECVGFAPCGAVSAAAVKRIVMRICVIGWYYSPATSLFRKISVYTGQIK